MDVYRYMKAKYWMDCVSNSRFATQFPSLLLGDIMEGFRDIQVAGPTYGLSRIEVQPTAYDSMYRVLCFTKASDRDKDLRHWHEHGDDGAGVRIRVSLAASEIITAGALSVLPVMYGNLNMEMLCEDDFLRALEKAFSRPTLETTVEDVQWLYRKRPQYSWEEEVRVVAKTVLWESGIEYRQQLPVGIDGRRYVDFIKIGGTSIPGKIIGVDFGWNISVDSVRDEIHKCLSNYPEYQFRRLDPVRYNYEKLT